MAVLNKIRERSIFLIIIIALALFSFVLADVIRNGGFSSGKGENTVATVGGENIDRTEFAKQVDLYSKQLGPNASTMQAVNRVYDAKVREVVLAQQFEKLGIEVSPEQLKATMALQLEGNPTFSDENGTFSEQKLQEYLANIKASSPQAYEQWKNYEDQVALAAKETQYFNMIKAGVGATLLEGKQAYLLENNTVDVEYVKIPWTAVDESEAQVSKDEIKAYIKAHPDKYTVEAGRDLQYVLFEEKASDADVEDMKAEVAAMAENRVESGDTLLGLKSSKNLETFVNANSDVRYDGNYKFKKDLPKDFADELFNLNKGEVYGPYRDGNTLKLSRLEDTKSMPDSAKARHILISYTGLQTATDVERTEEEAKQLADSLASVLRRDRNKFTDFATTYSADKVSGAKGGDLGFFTPGRMVPVFNDYVFQNNEGDLGVVKSQFGFHIIDIQEQTDKEKAVKLATIVREIEASEKTTNDLFAETTKFEIAAKKGDFAELAKSSDLTARPVKGVKALDENIPGVGRQRSIVSWAFNEETNVGDVKRFDVPQGYVVVQVTGENEKGLMNVEDASITATPIIKNNKKAEILKSRIKGNTLAEIAQNQGVQVQTSNALNLKSPTLTGAGNEPEVVGAAFSLKEGATSAPLQGKNGVYVVKVVKRNEATPLDNYKAFSVQESNKRTSGVNTKAYNALKEATEIEDNRSRFY